jgi:GNAT superfamily N-acetyltransferase
MRRCRDTSGSGGEDSDLDEDFTHLSIGMRETEGFLSDRLGKTVTVRACTTLDEETLGLFEYIDHRAFKDELWYGREEIALKSGRKGFIAFTVLMEGDPVGMLYGYELEPSTFFLDEVVALNEGKGIGRSLVKLLIQHCRRKGYSAIRLYTEEIDEKGRKLRLFYEGLGFRLCDTQPERGIGMRYSLEGLDVCKDVPKETAGRMDVSYPVLSYRIDT